MAVGSFLTPTNSDWVKPADWIDISSVGNNEINLLVVDNSIMTFAVTTASGTYSIDWGDGVVETGRVSGTAYQHTYALGAGTATSYGYNTVKIRIYGASGNITRFQCLKNITTGYTSIAYNVPVLWAVFGTNGLTSLLSAFGDGNSVYPTILQSVTLPSVLTGITTTGFNNTFANAYSLESVVGLNSPWGNITTMQNMFISCRSLKTINLPRTLPNTITTMASAFQACGALSTINNFPTSWPTSLTSLNSTFSDCYSLTSVTLPASFNTTTTDFTSMFANCTGLLNINFATTWPTGAFNCTSMFSGCRALTNITLPSTWAGCTNTTSMFANCFQLASITLPSTASNALTTVSSMFSSCYSLKNLSNTSTLGSPVSGTSMSILVNNGGSFITGSLSFGAKLDSLAVNGGGAALRMAVSGVRVTNATSTFASGASPQVNVSFTNLSQSALVDLFNDLPTVTGKTITITSATGAAALTAPERAIATGKGWTIVG